MGQLDVALAGGAGGPDLSEASAVLVRRGSGHGRVHASFLVPYCTLASCGGGAHYWARRDNA